jgi:cell division protein FtsB
MRREVKALTGDPAALERAAREDLGYVRPGEIILKLDDGGATR